MSSADEEPHPVRQPSRRAPARPPGPPSGPAPPSQPQYRPSVKIKNRGQSNYGTGSAGGSGQPNISQLKKQLEDRPAFRRRISKEEHNLEIEAAKNMNFLRTPDGGQARATRQSVDRKYL